MHVKQTSYEKMFSNRLGTIYHEQSDYDRYIPKSLSAIELVYDNELIFLLSEANY
ncbi:MAG: hypothetical protein SPI94_01545 [Candidatus Onthovivens sp.]|nr:hypothetical protein [Mollicutes bacterium]MDD7622268.1 hypothetical protein [Bacilli bacterium]MDY2724922.1 hypothetical protein [Candidatus Onthovivens sp.]MDY3995235.1 hypothetical protein [Candidatus Onthovivens sp.]MDY4214711.1 hypothetical protein [Candidatus Onthovivens sp.]